MVCAQPGGVSYTQRYSLGPEYLEREYQREVRQSFRVSVVFMEGAEETKSI